MNRLFYFFATWIAGLLLMGCATTLKPIEAREIPSIKSGRTATVLIDSKKQIAFTEDIYLVIGFAQVSSQSSYDGIWDSEASLSRVIAEAFTKANFQSSSLVLSPASKSSIASLSKELGEGKIKALEYAVPQTLLQDAERGGFTHLLTASWGGMRLHMPTLGLDPVQSTLTSYKLFSVPSGAILWEGSLQSGEKVTLPNKKGKDFYETDELKGLKFHSSKLVGDQISERRYMRSASLLQLMGLAEK